MMKILHIRLALGFIPHFFYLYYLYLNLFLALDLLGCCYWSLYGIFFARKL